MAAVAVCIVAVTFPLVLLQRWLLKTSGKYISVKGKARTRKFKPSDQFGPELVAFSRAVLDDGEIEPDGEEGLRDVRVIVAALKSAREKEPLTLSWPARHRRPEPRDRIYRPPVHEPRPVGVEAPTLE